jgi:hypothetical protein
VRQVLHPLARKGPAAQAYCGMHGNCGVCQSKVHIQHCFEQCCSHWAWPAAAWASYRQVAVGSCSDAKPTGLPAAHLRVLALVALGICAITLSISTAFVQGLVAIEAENGVRGRYNLDTSGNYCCT